MGTKEEKKISVHVSLRANEKKVSFKENWAEIREYKIFDLKNQYHLICLFRFSSSRNKINLTQY